MAKQYNDQEVTLYDLVNKLGLDYSKTGYMHCICPACRGTPERERKLHLDFDKNRWRCVKCDESGGVLRFFNGYVKGEFELPSDKQERGKLSGELREFMGMSNVPSQQAPTPPPSRPKVPEVQVASDDVLDKVYTEMMKIPDLQLTVSHREELRKRGLPDELIDRNGYRSVPDKWNAPPSYEAMYNEAGGNERARKNFDWLRPSQIKFGLMVAHCLVSKNLDLTGVPGFYKFGKFWCYWSVPGILIPTRNINRQIVIWQVRRDNLRPGMAKYITVSSQTLPGHVTGEVSRCHFPLGNAPLNSKVPVLITEGPLKADVASALYGAPTIFAAIPGISTTNDLMRYCSVFKEAQIHSVLNALDMDKLTNKNVRKGVHRLREKFEDHGITLRNLYWGTSYANFKLASLSAVAKIRHIPVPPPACDTVYDRLEAVCVALDEAHINMCKFADASGAESSYYWEPGTKGIDDHLLSLRG